MVRIGKSAFLENQIFTFWHVKWVRYEPKHKIRSKYLRLSQAQDDVKWKHNDLWHDKAINSNLKDFGSLTVI